MADDVAGQLEGRGADLVVGHSMGTLVALTLAAAQPELVGGLVREDPPALGPQLDPAGVAVSIEREAARARVAEESMEAELVTRNPLWARMDAGHDVANLRAVDVSAVTRWLRSERWDLAALVRDCPSPLHLLVAAKSELALTEPTRGEVLAFLGPERVTEVVSSHGEPQHIDTRRRPQ